MEEYKRLKREYMSRSENLPVVATTAVLPDHIRVNFLSETGSIEAVGESRPASTNSMYKTASAIKTAQKAQGDISRIPGVLPAPTVQVDHMQLLYSPPTMDPHTVALPGSVGEAVGAGIRLQPPPQYFQDPAGYEMEFGSDRVVYLVQNPFGNFPARQTFHASAVPVERYSAAPNSLYQNHFPESSFPVNVGTFDTTEPPSTFQILEEPVGRFLASWRQSHLSRDALDNVRWIEAPMRMDVTTVSERRLPSKSALARGIANYRAQQVDSLSQSIATFSSVNRETEEKPLLRKRARGMSSLPNIPTVIGSSSSLYTGGAPRAGATILNNTASLGSPGCRKAGVQEVLHSHQSTSSEESY